MERFSYKIALLSIIIITPLSTSASAAAVTANFPTESLESLGHATGNAQHSIDLIAEVNQAERDESNAFLSVIWSIENDGQDRSVLTWLSNSTYIYGGSHFSGITITSPETGHKYYPIMDSEGFCLCSGNTSNNIKNGLNPGDKISYWSTYSVPSDAKTLTVEIPGFDPIEDIPIS